MLNTREKELTSDDIAIISSKIDNISKQMTYTLQRSARSSIMSSARDFSTAICDMEGDVIALPNGFPVHAANMSLTAKTVFEFHNDDLSPGDAYLNNSPYHGNTHMADHTIIVPVFYENELMFLATIRGHQADVGNSVPTTYHAPAKDIYEEGALCFPCVQVQKNYKDIDDIIRMARMRIRVPDVWYGDFLAMIGAARIGERQLAALIEEYGKEVIKEFCQAWQAYGERRMTEEIKKLPAGTWVNETTHDAIPGLVDEGINVKVSVTIKPEEGKIVVDFTENGDPVNSGLNLCEATVLSSGRTGILNYLGVKDLPLCEGALSQIEVKMREKGVVGKASLPYSSSVATTNVADRAILAVQCALNGVEKGLGLAEGGMDQPPSESVISGYDTRYNRPFVTQLFTGVTGGMGVNGHDGYLPYGPSHAGMMEWNSIEMLEQKYPIQYKRQELIQNSGGAGQWDGAPAAEVVITPKEEVTFIYVCDGKYNPPRGFMGGHDGKPANASLYTNEDGENDKKELPLFNQILLKPGENLVSEVSSGGGYGNPLERDPDKVRHRVREGWISVEKAKDVYGVIIDTNLEIYEVDDEATKRYRNKLKEGER